MPPQEFKRAEPEVAAPVLPPVALDSAPFTLDDAR